MSGKRFFRSKHFAGKHFAGGHWAGAGVAVVVPNIPGIEMSIGGEAPHYSVHSTRPHYAMGQRPHCSVLDTRPHCAMGWQRPHYEVREET
jgi:hypothetical protein